MPTMCATVRSTITACLSAARYGYRSERTVSGDLIIRSGHVVTMDPELGDLPDGDVLVTGGRIAAVGAGLDPAALGAARGPGAGRPGDDRGARPGRDPLASVEHAAAQHVRGDAGVDGPAGYFSVSLGLGQAFTDDDNYQGTLLACAEAISSGITTVHDWSHNVRGPAHAEAELRALAQAGLRARYSYGYSAGHPNDQAMDLAGLRALHRDWKAGRQAPVRAAHPRRGLPRAGRQQPGHAGAAQGLPAGDGRRPRARPAAHRARLRAARRGRADRRAGRRGPARAGPAGGARQQRHRGGDRPARGGRAAR